MIGADLRARFLPRFTKLAAERVERSRAHVAREDYNALVSEMHALAGEAALLELPDIADLARQGERLARGSPSHDGCVRLLEELGARIAAIDP